jgi:hypothetical protein
MEGLNLTLGESGAPEPTRQDLEERQKVLAEKVQRDMRDLLDVLRADLPRFVERAVKERFVASREFAEKMSDADLRRLKADAAETGKALASEVLSSLEDVSLWLDTPQTPPSSEQHDLRGNAEVWRRLQRAGALLRDLLTRNGFPGLSEAEFAEAYRLPTWFTSGKYPKSVVESYWRNLAEYQTVRDTLGAMRERDEKARLTSRWDSA